MQSTCQMPMNRTLILFVENICLCFVSYNVAVTVRLSKYSHKYLGLLTYFGLVPKPTLNLQLLENIGKTFHMYTDTLAY